ncbi:hypothetical protein HDC90_000233 [Pedobacter sp. AK013]|nr:hypothetical protein [Pedobacter sp. AK013]
MQKRRAKRIKPRDATATKIEAYYDENEREKKFIKLISVLL